MRKLLLAFLAASVTSSAIAREYGSYDTRRLLIVSTTPEGKQYGVDAVYLDRMLNDLAVHANSYPPRFDTPQDQQRATQDAQALSGLLDILINVPAPPTELLARAGHLNSMGHNLDIPGAAEKANAIFLKLLAAAPADPRGNFMYGLFLAGAGKSREALPHLEKALALGVVEAEYVLGMAYVSMGKKDEAMKHLEAYHQRRPGDEKARQVIDALRKGDIKISRPPG